MKQISLRRSVWILFALAMVLGSAAHGSEVKGLFEAEIPVSGQGEQERQAAIRAALEEVLIKVSGYSAVLQEPALQGAAERAATLIQQYRYISVRSPAEAGKPATVSQRLWVRFGENGIQRLLKEAGLPIWGSARPSVLLWLATEEGGRRRLLSAAESDPAADLVLERARQRGLPVLLPLLDLEDRAKVTAADVWGGFHENLLDASRRYQPQAVLLGRLYVDKGRWAALWTLYQGEQPVEWQAEGTLEGVLRAGVDGTAESLSMRFAHAYDELGQTTLDVRVDAVRSLADYHRVTRYLAGLNGVKSVQLQEATAGQAWWRLRLEVRPETLAQAISLGSTLAPAPVPTGREGLDTGELTYRLLP